MERVCPKIDNCVAWTPCCNDDYVFCGLRDDINFDEYGLIIFEEDSNGRE